MKIGLVILAGVALVVTINYVAFNQKLKKVQLVEIQMPAPSTLPSAGKKPDISITVNSGHAYTLDGEATDIGRIRQRLAEAKARGKQSVAVVALAGADQADIVMVFDAVRAAGIEQISIETRDRTNP